MKCPKCQAENPEGMNFCRECGADGWVEKAEKELATLL
jgi:ribosomal protein L40E